MQSPTFEQTIQTITAADPRFDAEAYFFVREAMDFTRRSGSRRQRRDPGTSALLDGLRRYALETYGPMAALVLAEWGVRGCEDFGEIVDRVTRRRLVGDAEAALTERVDAIFGRDQR